MRKLYWKFCELIGYVIVFDSWCCPYTFKIKKNTHLSLLKFISKRDSKGLIAVKQIFTIQIKRL